MSRFPQDWPENCPPSDAQAAQGIVYRIVKREPCESSDFLTHAERGKAKRAPPCLRRGLSVYRMLDDARCARARYPWMGSRVAVGRLVPPHGMTKWTPQRGNSHTTLWVYDDVDRAAIFSTLAEG